MTAWLRPIRSALKIALIRTEGSTYWKSLSKCDHISLFFTAVGKMLVHAGPQR